MHRFPDMVNPFKRPFKYAGTTNPHIIWMVTESGAAKMSSRSNTLKEFCHLSGL